MSKFFSADQHIGEVPARGNPSYYRGVSPLLFQQIFLTQCHELLKKDDDLYLVGDLICNLENLAFYNQLPRCNLHIICGNKENRIENFAEKAEEILTDGPLSCFRGRLEILTGVQDVEINGRYWRVAHKPDDLCSFSMPKPAICGHVHGFWRTKKLPDGQPIINVGVDAWGYNLVTEEFLELQYEGIMDGSFARFIDFRV